MNFTKHLKKITVLSGVLVFAAMSIILLTQRSQTVYAADCKDQDGESKVICEASIASSACTDSDDAKSKACRYGFREAFKNPDKKWEEICSRYSGGNKNSCNDGVRKGRIAVESAGLGGKFNYLPGSGENQCGNLSDNDQNFKTKFDFGCLGSNGPSGLNPINDLVFAFIRFLSTGVGIVVILALMLSGIQYSASEGNPEASAKAKKRAQNALIGLILYMFAWSILQFIIPGGFFK